MHVDGLEGASRLGAVKPRGVCSTRRLPPFATPRLVGFRVTTNSTFFNTDSPKTVRDVLDFLNDDLKVDAMMISPGYAYEKAPDQEHFLGVEQTRRLFRHGLRRAGTDVDGGSTTHRFSSTSWKARSSTTAPWWAIPSYSVLGWQKPCYLMADGYAESYRELVETTDWDRLRPRSAIRAVRTAWRTADTNRPPSSPPPVPYEESLRQRLRSIR